MQPYVNYVLIKLLDAQFLFFFKLPFPLIYGPISFAPFLIKKTKKMDYSDNAIAHGHWSEWSSAHAQWTPSRRFSGCLTRQAELALIYGSMGSSFEIVFKFVM